MKNTSKSLSSSDYLRTSVALLEIAFAASSERLAEAEEVARRALRAQVTRPGCDDALAEANRAANSLQATREAHARAEQALSESLAMLAEALAAEKAEADAATRAKVRALLPSLTEAADAADEAFARFLGALDRARNIESEARTVLEKELGLFAFGGTLIPEAVTDATAHLRLVRTGNPDPLKPLTRERADAGARRIATALGEG